MGFTSGIVGLPNVGKSTCSMRADGHAGTSGQLSVLHNRPNVGRVAAPDPRLDALAGIARPRSCPSSSSSTSPARGSASKARGWAPFPGNIREVDAIAHAALLRGRRHARVGRSIRWRSRSSDRADAGRLTVSSAAPPRSAPRRRLKAPPAPVVKKALGRAARGQGRARGRDHRRAPGPRAAADHRQADDTCGTSRRRGVTNATAAGGRGVRQVAPCRRS